MHFVRIENLRFVVKPQGNLEGRVEFFRPFRCFDFLADCFESRRTSFLFAMKRSPKQVSEVHGPYCYVPEILFYASVLERRSLFALP